MILQTLVLSRYGAARQTVCCSLRIPWCLSPASGCCQLSAEGCVLMADAEVVALGR